MPKSFFVNSRKQTKKEEGQNKSLRKSMRSKMNMGMSSQVSTVLDAIKMYSSSVFSQPSSWQLFVKKLQLQCGFENISSTSFQAYPEHQLLILFGPESIPVTIHFSDKNKILLVEFFPNKNKEYTNFASTMVYTR